MSTGFNRRLSSTCKSNSSGINDHSSLLLKLKINKIKFLNKKSKTLETLEKIDEEDLDRQREHLNYKTVNENEEIYENSENLNNIIVRNKICYNSKFHYT
jgi:hypothetical protein